MFTYVPVTLATVYLSLERCICITHPFHVKHIFTPSRVIFINFAIAMFSVTCYISVWTAQRMLWLFDPSSNRTCLHLLVSPADIFSVAFVGMTLPVSAQIIVAVSTGVMLRGVNRLTTLRQRRETVWEPGMRFKHPPVTLKANSVNRTKNLTSKDVKLTKVVVLLATKYCICNVPVLTISFFRALVPNMGVGDQYFNMFELLDSLAFECRVINCVTDMFVYYNVSGKYRKQIRVLVRRSGFVKKI